MAKIVWTVQPVTDGYEGFVKIDSAVLDEPNRAWFSVSEEPFCLGSCRPNGSPGRHLPAWCETGRKDTRNPPHRHHHRESLIQYYKHRNFCGQAYGSRPTQVRP